MHVSMHHETHDVQHLRDGEVDRLVAQANDEKGIGYASERHDTPGQDHHAPPTPNIAADPVLDDATLMPPPVSYTHLTLPTKRIV